MITCIYFIRDTETQLIKIGVSTNLNERFRQLQGSIGHRLEVIRMISGGFHGESYLHEKFKSKRLGGEWFIYDEEMMSIIPPNEPKKKRAKTELCDSEALSFFYDLIVLRWDSHSSMERELRSAGIITSLSACKTWRQGSSIPKGDYILSIFETFFRDELIEFWRRK